MTFLGCFSTNHQMDESNKRLPQVEAKKHKSYEADRRLASCIELNSSSDVHYKAYIALITSLMLVY